MAACLKCDAELFDGSGRCPFCGAHEEGDAHIEGRKAEALPEGEHELTDAEAEALPADDEHGEGGPEQKTGDEDPEKAEKEAA